MGDSGEQPPDHPQAELSGRCSSVGSVSGPEIDPRLWHILLWKKLPSSADSRRASCQLLAKECALYIGKLPLEGMPRNSVVK